MLLDRQGLIELFGAPLRRNQGRYPRLWLFVLTYLLGSVLASRGVFILPETSVVFIPLLFALLLEYLSLCVYTTQYPWLKAGRVLLLILALGVWRGSEARRESEVRLPPPKTLSTVLVLETAPRATPWGASCEVSLRLVEDTTGEWREYPLRGKLRFYEDDSVVCSLRQGDLLLARINFRQYARRDSATGFDYTAWQRGQGLQFTARVRSNTEQRLGQASHESSIFARIHEHILTAYEAAGLEGQSLEIVKSMSVGDRTGLDRVVRQRFSLAGVAHILALSGLHVGFVYAILAYLVRGFLLTKFWRRLLRHGIPLVGVWFFVLIAGGTPSLLRAAIMLSVWGVSRIFFVRWHILDVLGIAAFLIVWLNPEALFSLSFQLSFAALLGIVLLYPYLKPYLRRAKHSVVRWILEVLSVSLCAQLGTLPLTLYTFGTLPLLALFTNLIAIPLASFIVPSSLLLALLPVGSWLARFVGFLLDLSSSFLIWSTEKIAALPFVSLTGLDVSVWQAWGIALVLLAVGVIGLVKDVGGRKKPVGRTFYETDNVNKTEKDAAPSVNLFDDIPDVKELIKERVSSNTGADTEAPEEAVNDSVTDEDEKSEDAREKTEEMEEEDAAPLRR